MTMTDINPPTSHSIGDIYDTRFWDGQKWQCSQRLILTDAPRDGNLWARQNGTWQQAFPINGGEMLALLIDYDLNVMGTVNTANLNATGTVDLGGQTNIYTLNVETNLSVNDTIYAGAIQSTEGLVTDNLIVNNNMDINGPSGLQISAGLHVIGNTILGGTVNIDNMTQTDPHVAGQLWNNAGVVNVSGG